MASILDRLGLDLAVLTEPPAALSVSAAGVVASPAGRVSGDRLEAWVAIVGSRVEPIDVELPYTRLAAAAHVGIPGHPLVVYGSVLPWRAATHQLPDLALPAESAADMFERFLMSQANDVRALQENHPEAMIVWAGDFNQSLDGSNTGGSNRGRALLSETLEGLGLEAWNRRSNHAVGGLCAIDLICGPREHPVSEIVRVDPAPNGRRLSDHVGYVVDLSS
jgi:endonuclease/exonuclease/phosphatase family metal-dependent hydrolase